MGKATHKAIHCPSASTRWEEKSWQILGTPVEGNKEICKATAWNTEE